MTTKLRSASDNSDGPVGGLISSIVEIGEYKLSGYKFSPKANGGVTCLAGSDDDGGMDLSVLV